MLNNIDINIDKSENYIQINNISTDDLTKIWEPLTTQYPGYEVVLCFRDMPAPMEALTFIGAELLEDCIKMQLTAFEHITYENNKAKQLTKDDFITIANLHDTNNPDMYWTSQRICDKWDDWRIFAIWSEGNITGYAMMSINLRDEQLAEVFCVEADNLIKKKALLSALAHCAFECGKKVIVYMVDQGDKLDYDAALAVGFSNAGYYSGYIVKL